MELFFLFDRLAERDTYPVNATCCRRHGRQRVLVVQQRQGGPVGEPAEATSTVVGTAARCGCARRRGKRTDLVFEGFEELDIATTDTDAIHGRRGGDGPPVLLLHGMPETHLMWHRVAPRLAERFSVVARPIAAGHFLPEEAPDDATRQLLAFLV